MWLADPRTRRARARAPEVTERRTDGVEAELFRHQVELTTEPHTDLADLAADVAAQRDRAVAAAEDAGLLLVAAGTVPLPHDELVLTDDARYRAMADRYGAVVRAAGTCGMHVHVEIASPEEGVRVLDRIEPYLPVVLALSAGSPFEDGRDTGHASWRSQQWARWPSAGVTEPFGDLAGYRAATEALVRSGAARDAGMLYLPARLAADYPTVEVRVADVMTERHDVVVLVALVRALVETAARDALPQVAWRTELLRAAHWRAAKDGPDGRLLHPGRPYDEPAPATDVVAAVLEVVADAATDAGDGALLEQGVPRLLASSGAATQRAVHARTGRLEDVVDDLARRTAGR